MRLRHWKPAIARETAMVQIAGTPWRSGWSQLGRYGFNAIITIQKTGIPVAIVHLIRSHLWRVAIEVTRNWSVAISASRSLKRRGYASRFPRPTSWTARRLRIRIGDRSIRRRQAAVAVLRVWSEPGVAAGARTNL